jgi:hypothetical protein
MITNTDFTRPACALISAFTLFGDFQGAFQTPAFGRRRSVDQSSYLVLSGNQITANVYLGESGSPEVEAEILDRVGTYGRQLGQTADAMIVLLRHLPDRANLAPEEREAIEAFEKMANDIAKIKEKHKLQAVRP